MSNVRLKLPPKLIESARASQYANRERQGVRETEVKLKKKAKRQAEEEVKKKQLDKDKQPDGRRVGGQLEHEKRERYKIWTRRRKRGGVGFILVPSGQYTEGKLEVVAELDQDTVAFTDKDFKNALSASFMDTVDFNIVSTETGLALEPGTTSGSYSFEIQGSPYNNSGSSYNSSLRLLSITKGPVTGYNYDTDSYITPTGQVPFNEAELNWTAEKTKQATYEFFVILGANAAREKEIRRDPFPNDPNYGFAGMIEPEIYTRTYWNEMVITVYQESQFSNLEFRISNNFPDGGSLSATYTISNATADAPPGRHHIAAVYDLPDDPTSNHVIRRIYFNGQLKTQTSGTFNDNKPLRAIGVTYAGQEYTTTRSGQWEKFFDSFGDYTWVWQFNSQQTVYSTNVPKIALQSFRFTPGQALYKGQSFTPPTTITDLAD